MCESWAKARASNTDHSLEYQAICIEMDDRFYCGADIVTDPLEYCPWCGKKLPDTGHE